MSSYQGDSQRQKRGASTSAAVACQGTGALQTPWKEDSLLGLARGSQVWVSTENKEWAPGILHSVSGTACTVALESSGGVTQVEVAVSAVVPANPTLLDCIDDLTGLSYLNEPSILNDLRQRYAKDMIYTLAGPVLIAVNPYTRVPLYSGDIVQQYCQRDSSDGAVRDLQPHVFLTADMAYKAMCKQGRSQSLVISGESGAGKTETTKIAMQYLAGLAGGTGVEEQVLATNPLLEAFGNAKTLRNKNSSRFGKLIDIHFDAGFHICGAKIQTYLLEKSRVVHQLPGERGYHIFYQLCRGATPQEALRYRLPEDPIASFCYLSSSGCTSIEGVDDAEEFTGVRNALEAVGIEAIDQDQIYSLLAGILWLGNIAFDAATEDTVKVRADKALANAAALLGCEEAALASALCSRNITAGRGKSGTETIAVALGLEAARDARDALAKALYASLFSFLVECVNDALGVHTQEAAARLSILDIYGFECFDENSFEQLCINYANERLQQLFNRHLFKLEQEAYESEGIDWAHIDFEDNQACVDLIENRPPRPVGIISLLDEECLFPKGTDLTFGAKLRGHLAEREAFAFNARQSPMHFMIHHYAGRVDYNCSKILDKNRDNLSQALAELVQCSDQPLVVTLASDLVAASERRGSTTVGTIFREQLRDLVQRLEDTELHFVRCIKPNEAAQPGVFASAVVLHQLRCCGVLEVTRIARAGYPTRFSLLNFASRFQMLLPDFRPGANAMVSERQAVEVTRAVLQHFRVSPALYQIGRTKLFLRAGVLGHLEDLRARICRSVLTIQSTWRMVGPRQQFLRLRHSTVQMQAQVRRWQAALWVAQLRHRHAAATHIQAAWRGYWVHQSYLTLLTAVITLQMGVRRWQFKQRVAHRAYLRDVRERSLRAKAEAENSHRAEHIAREQSTWRPQRPMENGHEQEEIQAEASNGWRSSAGPSAHASPRKVEVGGIAVGGGIYASAYGSPGAFSQLSMPRSPQWQENAAAENGTAMLVGGGDHMSAAEARAAEQQKETTTSRLLSSAAYQQIELWEDYANKLEEQMRLLLAENAGLRVSLAEAHRAIAEAPLAATAPEWTEVWRQTQRQNGHSQLSSATSHGEDERIPAGANGHGPREPEKDAATRYVGTLAHELDRKRALFLDDAAFVAEVREGRALAPGMDPEAELRTLKQRFATFKRDFKVRLGAASEILKRVEKQERKVLARDRKVAPASQIHRLSQTLDKSGAVLSNAELRSMRNKKLSSMLSSKFNFNRSSTVY